MPVALTRFAGRAGDHKDRAMVASGLLTAVLAESEVVGVVVGELEAHPGSRTGFSRCCAGRQQRR